MLGSRSENDFNLDQMRLVKQKDACPVENFPLRRGFRHSKCVVTPTGHADSNFENDTSSVFLAIPDEPARRGASPGPRTLFRNRRKLPSIMYLFAKIGIAPNLAGDRGKLMLNKDRPNYPF